MLQPPPPPLVPALPVLPPVPVPLPPVPVLPPEPPPVPVVPPSGATVNEQKTLLHTAPREWHLQSLSTLHQPSLIPDMPGFASMHAEPPELFTHTCVPQAVPGQSLSTSHAVWADAVLADSKPIKPATTEQ